MKEKYENENQLRKEFEKVVGVPIDKMASKYPPITATVFTVDGPNKKPLLEIKETDIHREIFEAIKQTTNSNVLASWGSNFHFWFVDYYFNPAVAFYVHGLLHTGYVVVGESDCPGHYYVTLMTEEAEEVRKAHTDRKSLGLLIDILVERGTCPENEYRRKAYACSLRNLKNPESIVKRVKAQQEREKAVLARICAKGLEWYLRTPFFK